MDERTSTNITIN